MVTKERLIEIARFYQAVNEEGILVGTVSDIHVSNEDFNRIFSEYSIDAKWSFDYSCHFVFLGKIKVFCLIKKQSEMDVQTDPVCIEI